MVNNQTRREEAARRTGLGAWVWSNTEPGLTHLLVHLSTHPPLRRSSKCPLYGRRSEGLGLRSHLLQPLLPAMPTLPREVCSEEHWTGGQDGTQAQPVASAGPLSCVRCEALSAKELGHSQDEWWK